MRLLFPFLSAALLAAAPASAQQLGARTAPPEELLEGLGEGVSDAELARAVAAAAAFPLGTIDNPVRAGGPEGARAYLARLRCADGSSPVIGREGAAGIGAYGTLVDAWPLDCAAAAPGKAGIVMDIYHDGHDEQRPPPGFAIAPR